MAFWHVATSVGLAQCQLSKFLDPNEGVHKWFGHSVAVGEDEVFVGGLGGKGAVFVYTRAGAAWQGPTKITGPKGGQFGWSMSLDGDRLLVGAKDVNWAGNPGAAYVLERIDGQWTHVAELVPTSDATWVQFGYAVALSGDTAIISAFNDNHGKVYVFERAPTGQWIEKQKLLSVGEVQIAFPDYYGRKLAIDGDVAIVGASVDQEFGSFAGAAHLFERQTNGTWIHIAKMTEPGAGGSAQYGTGVAVRGDTLFIGAGGVTSRGFPSAGAVYCYTRVADRSWALAQVLKASDPANSDRFGDNIAVDIDEDILVVGAFGDDEQAVNVGSVYVFTLQPRGFWTEQGKVIASDGLAFDELSRDSLAVDGNLCVAGAWHADPFGPNSGAAYVFAVGPDADGDGIMDACECPGDIDKDWVVDQGDLGILLAAFGACPGDAGYHAAAGTLDSGGGPGGDPCVDQSDLGVLLAHYGVVCP